MIEQATLINGTNQTQDQGYKSWQSSVGKTVMRLDPEARTAGPIPTFGRMVHDNVVASQSYAPAGNTVSNGTPDIAYESSDKDYSFGDVIDMINPLQHLPVIGTLYRKFTGDTIKPMSDIIGGAIFGGPVGAVASTMNAVVKSTTGKDIAENAFAFAGFDVSPKAKTAPMITYENSASFASDTNVANTNYMKLVSTAADAYATADGRRNFAARNAPVEIWNA